MKIYGNTVDEKFRSVGKAIERLNKKISKSKAGPTVYVSPLCFYAEEIPEDEVISRYMFPVDGWLHKLMVRMQNLEVGKETVDLKVNIYNSVARMQKTVSIKSKSLEDSIDLPIESGDFMEIVTNKAPVYVAFTYKMYPSGKELRDERIQENFGAEAGSEAVQEGIEEGGTSGELPESESEE